MSTPQPPGALAFQEAASGGVGRMGQLGAELGPACSPVPLTRPHHCTISQVGELGIRLLGPRTLGWLDRNGVSLRPTWNMGRAPMPAMALPTTLALPTTSDHIQLHSSQKPWPPAEQQPPHLGLGPLAATLCFHRPVALSPRSTRPLQTFYQPPATPREHVHRCAHLTQCGIHLAQVQARLQGPKCVTDLQEASSRQGGICGWNQEGRDRSWPTSLHLRP